jgi:O-antigen ligase
MKFKEWKRWVGTLPWLLRWFVFLVLLRPFIDGLFFLKNISPFLSPLNIVGVLTPFLCVIAMIRFHRPRMSGTDILFSVWSVILIASSFFLLLIYSFSISSLEFFLKLSLPAFLFPFTRYFVNSRKNLHGILQTFLYSCFFAILIFVYARLTGVSISEETRGLERYSGFYADVANLGFYITLGFLVYAYLMIESRPGTISPFRNWKFLAVILICLIGLINIKHVTTIGVFLSIFLLFVFYAFRSNFALVLLVGAFVGVFYFTLGRETIEQNVDPLLRTEISVLKGEKEKERALHGRVSRWPEMFETFHSLPFYAILIGAPFSMEDIILIVTGGVHNDFFRILFLTGYLGLLFYLAFLLNISLKIRHNRIPERFLGWGSIIIIFLYSVTLLPMMYPNLLYIIFSVFAFLMLPLEKRYETR